ncbi:MAG: AAA family ATPase [Phycisphaeraceae bacterium]|nr:AAA family ATPase [Phycisphaeraceae bacterium]
MKFSFENFGPIASGHLELRPLTIIVGPNQSGKSFAAMAIHSFLKGISSLSRRQFFPLYGSYGFYFDEIKEPRYPEQLNKLHARAQKLQLNQQLRLSDNELAALESLTQIARIKNALKTSLEEVFSVSSHELLRHKSKSGYVKVESADWSMQVSLPEGKASASFELKHAKDYSIAYIDRRRKDTPAVENKNMIIFKPSDIHKHASIRAFIEDIGYAARKMHKMIRLPHGIYPFYLPAIRSGLLLSHRLFLSLLLRNVQRAGLEPLSIPQMTGVTADFLQSLLQIQDSREAAPGMVADIINHYESLMTSGEVYANSVASETIRSYRFKTSGGLDIPLNLASSTVTELAPIFLLLRKFVKADEWVIIEEPESHLSPKNQAIMARFLAALVNKGVRVFITTHSTFLLEQLNNLIAAHRLREKPVDAIDPSVVSAHHAVVTDKNGSVLSSLNIDPDDGIDLSDFVSAYETIYEEGYRNRRRADVEKSNGS